MHHSNALLSTIPACLAVRPNPAEPARPSESGRTQIWDGRPNPAELRFGTAVRIRPSSDWGRPPECGRTQIWDGRPNPAELRLGTAVRILPNSDLGRPAESGRTQIGDDRPNPAEKHIKHDRNQSWGSILHALGSKLGF